MTDKTPEPVHKSKPRLIVPLIITVIGLIIIGVVLLIVGKVIFGLILALFGAVVGLGSQVRKNLDP